MSRAVRVLGQATLLLACAVVLATSCATPAPPSTPLPPPLPPPISEETLRPVERPKIEITNLNEIASADHKTVTVTGTLVNRGMGPTRAVYVHVEALDKDGAVVVSADSDPSTETVQPGGTGTFSVMFENRPGIDRYHVEAISR
jgi:hypothetical protein